MLPLRKRAAWSAQELDTHDLPLISRHDRGVSSCTKRENSSQEQATVKLDSSLVLNGRKGARGDQGLVQSDTAVVESPCARKQTMEMIEADFKEEVIAMESQIADLGKSLSMNRFSKEGAEAKANEEREAEKRRREAEIRKARLKEKNARDPHRKIQMKLENRRRFEMDSLDKAGIPTTSVTFQGHAGYEKQKMVDVQALRNKCQGLAEGIHSVPKLVEMQQRREHVSSMMASTSMPSLGAESMASEETSRPSCKDRYQKSCGQRQRIASDNFSRKGNTMQMSALRTH